MADLHLKAGEVKFLASRLRRLFDHFGYELPDLAVEDTDLIRITGTCIGDLLRRLNTTGVMAAPAPAEPQPSAQGPAALWLQLHGDCSEAELSEPVDYTSGDVTWCWHAINDTDVRYVRADLAGVAGRDPQTFPPSDADASRP
jgi:hypothetical protein